MTFGMAPLLVAAGLLVTAALVWLLYRVRPEPQPVRVPSNLIWRRVLDERRRREDFWRWLISLLIALLTALSVALALSRPSVGDGQVRRLALVLDTSPAMAAVGADGESRWERAAAEARRRLEAAGETGEFLILDTAGQRGGRSFIPRRQALAALDELGPVFGAEHRFPDLADLLPAPGEAGDPRGVEVAFLGDGVAVPEVPSGVERVSVFEPAANAGITAFDVRPLPGDPGRFEAYVEVVRHPGATEAPADDAAAGVVALQIDGAGGASLRRVLRVEPGAPTGETVPLTGFVAGPVRAVIAASGGDGFAADDVAHAYVPSRNRLRVLLAAADNPYWEAALRLDPRVTLRAVPPEGLAEAGFDEVDLIVLDGPPPETLPRAPLLFAGAGEADWLPPRVGAAGEEGEGNATPSAAASGAGDGDEGAADGAAAEGADEAADPTAEDDTEGAGETPAVMLPVTAGAEEHPVLAGLHLEDALAREVRAFAAESLNPPGGDGVAGGRWTQLLGDSRLGLLAARESPRRALAFAFPLERSNLALQADFPVLLSRALSWLTDVEVRRAGLGPVRVRMASGTIFDAEGDELESRYLGAELTFEAERPSLYYASGGGREVVVAANLLDRRISAVNRTGWGELPTVGAARTAGVPEGSSFPVVWPYLALLALVLLVAEWVAFHRNVTV